MDPLSVVVLGAIQSGKTALITQICNPGTFREMYQPTIQDSYRTFFKSPTKEDIELEICEIGGEHNAMRDLDINRGDAFILVYNLDSRASFVELETLLHLVMQIKEPCTPPIVIIANKSDLSPSQVRTEEGKQLATQAGCYFLEVSAKSGEGTMEVLPILMKGFLMSSRKGKLSLRRKKSKGCKVM
eukprot:TRINITY_DN7095_c0_g1_i1.p1 TRINITY_DN7095_c0_g1~~TRINITY_DN7095_c0_g1_i1.p1  ORF type:complete len:186 (+),score=26.13 TRINITY_DN7095_c0_g1_i1:36-593(+)